jgi:hypothetical protein
MTTSLRSRPERAQHPDQALWRCLLVNSPARKVERHPEWEQGQVAGDLPKAASLIASAFYETWWNSPEFEASREKWAEQCTSIASPLTIEVAQRLGGADIVDDPDLRAELALLRICQVDSIITTNYDILLEEAFPSYAVFSGQKDLLLRRSYQLAEIYKIHGSIDQPDSLVLTGDDYKVFEAESPYLVAKLMSVFVEHPIVFLGYSLTDPNVRCKCGARRSQTRHERPISAPRTAATWTFSGADDGIRTRDPHLGNKQANDVRPTPLPALLQIDAARSGVFD